MDNTTANGLMETQVSYPFDRVAESYDRAFTRTRLGLWLRAEVRAYLEASFRPGDHVLELGCGTGEDAIWLAQRGVHVTATDASQAMLEIARRKVKAAGVEDRVSLEHLDLAEAGDLVNPAPNHPSPFPIFDGAFANFGVLNCLADRRSVAQALARWVRPGGRVIFVVMGPLCLWEIAWHLVHGKARTALRRWRSGVEARVGNGAKARVWYPSPRRLRQEFAPHFRHLRTVGIGVLLPPSYLGHLVERWPRLFRALAGLDRRLGQGFPWAWLGDHYLVVLERDLTPTPTPSPYKGEGDLPPTPGPSPLQREERKDLPPPTKGRVGEGVIPFACPACRTPLEALGPDEQRCPADGTTYRRVDGIWRFLAPDREAFFRQFLREYEAIRRAEGRGSDDPAYYRALPFEDRSGRLRDQWRIRARSYQVLLQQVVQPLASRRQRALQVLDLGAGNGWLSYRLAQHGHHVAAIDLKTDTLDGLGAHIHYGTDFIPIQAEFDRLPLVEGQVDLAIFNASFHYALDYTTTLTEIWRVLRDDGQVVIMDSPVYHDPASGEQMVREREAQFQEKYGFPSNALPSENYLTYARLDELAQTLGIRWTLIRPFYGLRWALRPWKARLLGHREPAQFLLIVGKRRG